VGAYQVVDALCASFFALLGIWAAVVRRHWFLRFAVVTAVLLSTLLVPAYEVALEFAIQISIIAFVVWTVRGGPRRQFRFSVETSLLATVVVSIVAAVLARAPQFSSSAWIEIASIAVVTAAAGLLGLWFVCSDRRWGVRLTLGALGLLLLFALIGLTDAARQATVQLTNGQPWGAAFANFFAQDKLTPWFWWNLPTIGVGMVIVVTMLTFGRASGWFSAMPSFGRRLSKHELAARAALCLLALAISLPLGVILIQLTVPPAFPSIQLPSPNGYDDFVAAGEDARQCRDVAGRLFTLDQSREPWSQLVHEQQLIDRRAGWMSRYWSIVDQWRGAPYEWHYKRYRDCVFSDRALAVMYALRAYALEHKAPPDEIQSLMPDLLPAIPDDPFGSDQFKMVLTNGGVAVYCLGEDGDDDGGEPYKTDLNGQTDISDGDLTWTMTAIELGLEKDRTAGAPAK
jgi:hypothetical protein